MKLTIIRGLPGSGKSTLAKTIPGLHVEADMYYIINGKYQFDTQSVGHAHAWCARIVEAALEKGADAVVSNTFTQKWEMDRYFDMAKDYNAEVEVITCRNNYGTIHNVPEDVMEKMRSRWEE